MDKIINYQQASLQLDEIIDQLQAGSLTIDESIKKYEQGMKLIDDIQKYLKSAENKVTKLKQSFEKLS